MVDRPSQEWLKKMADGEDAAGGSVPVGGMADDLGATEDEVDAIIAEMESGSEAGNEILSTIAKAVAKHTGMPPEASLLVEVANFVLVDGGWKATLHKTLDRGTSLDELGFLPEHFKPGTVVIVLEPRE